MSLPDFRRLSLEDIEPMQDAGSYARLEAMRAEWRKLGHELFILEWADGTLSVLAHPPYGDLPGSARLQEIYDRARSMQALLDAVPAGHKALH